MFETKLKQNFQLQSLITDSLRKLGILI